jgi:ankyrin repeat protein
MVRLLIDSGADLNMTTYQIKETALMFAAHNIYFQNESCMSVRNIGIIQQLLRAGADASIQDIEGNTIIERVAIEYRKKLQELIDNNYGWSNGYQAGQLK